MNKETLKQLLKETFVAGDDYSYYTNMGNSPPDFKEWYESIKIDSTGDEVHKIEINKTSYYL